MLGTTFLWGCRVGYGSNLNDFDAGIVCNGFEAVCYSSQRIEEDGLTAQVQQAGSVLRAGSIAGHGRTGNTLLRKQIGFLAARIACHCTHTPLTKYKQNLNYPIQLRA